MQKTIRILAIISTALVGSSLLFLIASFPLQQELAQLWSYNEQILDFLPIFPLIPFLFCLLRTAATVLLIVFCGNKRCGIWFEILMIALLVILLPLLNNVATYGYTAFVNRLGNESILANAIVTTISSYCCYLAGWGGSLALVTCGMSIAYKSIKKQ